MSDTALTVIGMIAAFVTASVTAFFAEPVKLYFQNRDKLKSLRTALYKETISNFVWLDFIDHGNWDRDSDLSVKIVVDQIEPNLRDDCYRQHIATQADTFYQLKEAILFGNLYGTLSNIHHFRDDAVTQEKQKEQGMVFSGLHTACRTYVFLVVGAFDDGTLDRGFLSEIVDDQTHRLVMERANRYHKRSSKGEG